jgi:hypothetical protein
VYDVILFHELTKFCAQRRLYEPVESKMGLVRRKAADKSSLMLYLFRTIELELDSGILIDGVNIQAVPLQTLRSSVTIIPQDPFMFSGTHSALQSGPLRHLQQRGGLGGAGPHAPQEGRAGQVRSEADA